MKIIHYSIPGYTDVYNPDTDAIEHKEVLSEVTVRWSEANEERVKLIAYNGEYTIEDDGAEEDVAPTQLDRVEAQVTYTAMMTDTLLEV